MGEVSRLLADYGPAFGQALWLTWKLTVLSFVPGFLLGVLVTVLRLLPLPPLRFVLRGYVEIFRNIPSVALLIALMLSTSLASQVPFPGRELTALVSKIATDSAAGIPAFAVAATLYVATGLLIAWAGARLEKKARILR